ncbi:metal-dependent hydrolase [Massilia horti]|uniref:Metal-dependent hydrolase n=1 Tax=Massilia horti TaxID=2562153 RepID=A0A4Y9SSY8_9BURK|nr:metal-dependent hydrolase [Massilia horti]TFW28459.1 metal-dependent hydrolase [Massilia horti]
MDNLTHSVTGLAMGELVERSLPPETDSLRARTRRKLLLFTCWAASNFPDLDLLLTRLSPRPLGYLLHHRGYTHTLVGVLPQAALLLSLTWLLWPGARRLLRGSPAARAATVGVALFGLLLHVAMDYLNVYGVHPFHPFDSRWMYGDMVFIVEPVFWVALGTPLAVMASRPIARLLLFALLAGGPLFFTVFGYLQWGSLLGLFLLGALLVWLERGGAARNRKALVTGLAAGLGFVAIQAVAVQSARELVTQQLTQRDPGTQVLDVPVLAVASNPLCWGFVTIESNDALGNYRLTRGALSLAPSITPVSNCPTALGGPGKATEGTALIWLWEEHGKLSRLRELASDNCYFNAWMRFARAPSLVGGSATDVRFGTPGSPNFSTLNYAQRAGAPCPRNVPGWGFPRADLLGLH